MKAITHISKVIGLSLVLFGITSCGGTRSDGAYPFEENPPFTLGTVAYQEWVAGAPGGGSGINVFIPVEEFRAEVKFREIYFRKQVVKVKSRPDNPDLFMGYFETKLNRPDVVMDGDHMKEAKNTPPKQFPFDLEDDEAVLSYEYGGEILYMMIYEMEQKPMLAYPMQNPDKID